MSERTGQGAANFGGKKIRRRMRGMFENKTGRSIGIASIAAPLIGYVVNDLQKPDSLIRALIGRSVKKLLPLSQRKSEIIDISDKVEIIEDSSQ